MTTTAPHVAENVGIAIEEVSKLGREEIIKRSASGFKGVWRVNIGKEFHNKHLAAVLSEYGVKYLTTPPYHA